MTMTPSSVTRVMISSSMRVGFMSLDSFGVGVVVSAACAAKAKRRVKANGVMIFVVGIELSMSKNGPRCPFGQ